MAAPKEMRADLRYIRLCTPFASIVPHHAEGVAPFAAHQVSVHVRSVPPIAAEGLEQCDRVRVAVVELPEGDVSTTVEEKQAQQNNGLPRQSEGGEAFWHGLFSSPAKSKLGQRLLP